MRFSILLCALSLAVAACGNDSVASTTTTTAPTTTLATTTTATPTTGAPSGLGAGFNATQRDVTTSTTTPPTGYVTVTDDSGQIEVSIRAAWTDVLGAAWAPNGESIGPAISAASDVDAWYDGWDTAGLFIGATDTYTGTVDDVLDEFVFSEQCTYDARYDYDDGLYVGGYDWYDDCGGIGSTFVVVVARPEDESFTIVVQIVMITGADIKAGEEILRTFLVSSANP